MSSTNTQQYSESNSSQRGTLIIDLLVPMSFTDVNTKETRATTPDEQRAYVKTFLSDARGSGTICECYDCLSDRLTRSRSEGGTHVMTPAEDTKLAPEVKPEVKAQKEE